jgi:hypothetical protein
MASRRVLEREHGSSSRASADQPPAGPAAQCRNADCARVGHTQFVSRQERPVKKNFPARIFASQKKNLAIGAGGVVKYIEIFYVKNDDYLGENNECEK